MKKTVLALCAVTAAAMTACASGQDTAPTTTAATQAEQTTAAQETTTAAQTEAPATESASGSFEGTGSGYGGELKLEVTVTDGKMEKIDVLSHHESSVVYNRSVPMITERILEAQSPEVDSVSGATFTSYAVKAAVAQAMKEAGVDFGDITLPPRGRQQNRSRGGRPYPAGDRRRWSGRPGSSHHGQGERSYRCAGGGEAGHFKR